MLGTATHDHAVLAGSDNGAGPHDADAGPAQAEVHVPQVAPAEPQEDVPWDVLFPRKNIYRDAIVKHALPRLLVLLKDPSNRLRQPRDLVNTALDQCKASENHFWGKDEVYTRKRSACDAILCHYFDTLQDYVSGRRVVAGG